LTFISVNWHNDKYIYTDAARNALYTPACGSLLVFSLGIIDDLPGIKPYFKLTGFLVFNYICSPPDKPYRKKTVFLVPERAFFSRGLFWNYRT
jgi:hypothetical protein